MNIKINDKKYWSDFYSNNTSLAKNPSPFAEYLLSNSIIKKGDCLIELGCGNGRDSMFFAKNNISVTAIDQCKNTTSILNKLENIESYSHDFTNLPVFEKKLDVVYSRFTLHAINEKGEANTLKWAFENLVKGGLLCVEVRTLKDPIFGKGIDKGNNIWFYNNHHRRFVNSQKLKDNLVEMGFKIEFFKEKNGFAKYKDNDPVLLRAIVRK